MSGYAGASWLQSNFENKPLTAYSRNFSGEPIGAHFSGMGKAGSMGGGDNWNDILQQLALTGAAIYSEVAGDGSVNYKAYDTSGKLVYQTQSQAANMQSMLIIGGLILFGVFLLKK